MRLPRHRKRLPGTYAPALLVAILLFAGGWLLIRRSASTAPTSMVLESYLKAGKNNNCDGTWFHLSSRTKSLMLTFQRDRSMQEEEAIKQFCSFSPGTSDLESFILGSSRTESVDGASATVVAKYKYDRFFGFFGEGTAKQRFDLVSERGGWKIDYSDEIDPNSRSNMDEEAMRLAYQGWTSERSFFAENGFMTAEPAYIQGELPGYPFGSILGGVATASSRRGTLHVALASNQVACLSVRSESGTIVMIKLIEGAQKGSSFEYGSVPRSCNKRPLARAYHGYSAKITYPTR